MAPLDLSNYPGQWSIKCRNNFQRSVLAKEHVERYVAYTCYTRRPVCLEKILWKMIDTWKIIDLQKEHKDP